MFASCYAVSVCSRHFPVRVESGAAGSSCPRPATCRLTESAEALVAHAEAVFAQLGEAQADLEAIAGGVGGRIRFGSFPTATAT